MIPIKKKGTPDVLLAKQEIAKERGLNSNDAYNLLNHEEKQIILNQMMEEQGHLCAYCMRKIPDERPTSPDIEPVTIEHWFPRNPPDYEERGQGLDYDNMFAVCSGNRGRRHTRRTRDYTCDAKRAKNHPQLTLNPCDPTTLTYIRYKDNGEMYSENPDVQDDITVKLNLNCVSNAVLLPQTRERVLNALKAELPVDNPAETLAFCIYYLNMYESETDPKTPYSGILIFWLRDYISNMKSVM